MDKIIDAIIERSKAVVIVFLLIIIIGYSLFSSIPKEEYPEYT